VPTTLPRSASTDGATGAARISKPGSRGRRGRWKWPDLDVEWSPRIFPGRAHGPSARLVGGLSRTWRGRSGGSPWRDGLQPATRRGRDRLDDGSGCPTKCSNCSAEGADAGRLRGWGRPQQDARRGRLAGLPHPPAWALDGAGKTAACASPRRAVNGPCQREALGAGSKGGWGQTGTLAADSPLLHSGRAPSRGPRAYAPSGRSDEWTGPALLSAHFNRGRTRRPAAPGSWPWFYGRGCAAASQLAGTGREPGKPLHGRRALVNEAVVTASHDRPRVDRKNRLGTAGSGQFLRCAGPGGPCAACSRGTARRKKRRKRMGRETGKNVSHWKRPSRWWQGLPLPDGSSGASIEALTHLHGAPDPIKAEVANLPSSARR